MIIPTLEERESIVRLIPRVADVLREAGIDAEILVVDDASADGTAGAVRELADRYPCRVVVRENERGLSGAVIRGIEAASGEVIAVMDADLSHPAEVLPTMYARVRDGAGLVVGSRHVPGGGFEDWPLHRRIISRVAGWLAFGLSPVSDPTSGFLMFPRRTVDGAELESRGFKIGLELMVKGRHDGRIEEVPIVFVDRRYGSSKLSGEVSSQYLGHLVALRRYRRRARRGA